MGLHSVENLPTGENASVGARIINARKDKDMTQMDLSKRLGVSRAAVGQWEINATSPSIQKISEIAMVLGVAPEWLAYNVREGESRIVYKSPERDNVVWIDAVDFGTEEGDLNKVDTWGIPHAYLSSELRANPEQAILCTVNSHAVEPEFEYGDKVIVDKSDTKPSPAGVFVFWDGIGYAFARMQAVPGKTPMVRIAQKGADSYDVALSEVKIVGRVKGRFQRG